MPLGKRKRAGDENAESDEKKSSIDELNSKIDNQQNIIEEMRGKQELILEKLKKLEKSEKEESETDNKPSFNSVISPGFLKKNAPSTGTPSIGRSFVLKHTFEDFSELEEGEDYSSEDEDQFGVPWSLYIIKREQRLDVFLACRKSLNSGTWAINTKVTFRLIGVDGRTFDDVCDDVYGNADGNVEFDANGLNNLIAWEDLKNNYLIEDKLTLEVHVEISEMSGIYKGNLRCFDESMKDVSDVVLAVGNRKFHVSKLCLATHSSYFKTLFLGSFQESNQSEIELSGISPEDFQNYLEVHIYIYGDPAIDDTTVEGILLVADMYDTSIVIRKCIDFLVEKSEKSTKKKMQMAIRYNLGQLKKKLIANMKTLADIKSVIPENPEDLDHSIAVELLNKSLSLR